MKISNYTDISLSESGWQHSAIHACEKHCFGLEQFEQQVL